MVAGGQGSSAWYDLPELLPSSSSYQSPSLLSPPLLEMGSLLFDLTTLIDSNIRFEAEMKTTNNCSLHRI